MRQLQKGDQGPRQRDYCRIRLASVLILRTLRKANHRVPEETQASPAQGYRIAAHRIPHPTMTATDGVFLFLAFSRGRKHPSRMRKNSIGIEPSTIKLSCFHNTT